MIGVHVANFLCVFFLPGDYVKLKIHTPMYTIAKALASPNSGLEVKDRVWLKITIPKSFIGKHLILVSSVIVTMIWGWTIVATSILVLVQS